MNGIALDEERLSGRVFVDSCVLIAAYGKPEERTELSRAIVEYAFENKRLVIPAPVFAELMCADDTDPSKIEAVRIASSENVSVVSFGFREAQLFKSQALRQKSKYSSKIKLKYDRLIIACVSTKSRSGDVFVTLDDNARNIAIANGIDAPELYEFTKKQSSFAF